MSTTVKQIVDKHDWRHVLEKLGDHDFVHTYDFHKASQENGEGSPVLFSLMNAHGQPTACWPTLKRHIPDTNFFDLTSVYGYGGPLFSKDTDCFTALNEIWNGMSHSGAISIFSRMHPLFVEEIPDAALRGQQLSEVVVIDVKQHTNLLASYRGSHRREIQNAHKLGVKIMADLKCSNLLDFATLYRDSMQDLQAADYYYFSDNYFYSLKNSQDFKTFILFAQLDGINIAASMFIVTGKVMQYYLSGTVGSYRKLSPSKAIIAFAHELAIKYGVEKIILGGGVGSAQDALFKFKAGFSDLTKPFYITKKILNAAIYQNICTQKNINPDQTAFFPAYRAQ